MRRWLVLMCMLGLVVGSALPAGAQEDDRETGEEATEIAPELESEEEADVGAPETVEGEAGSTVEQAVQLIEPSVVFVDMVFTAWIKDQDGDWLNDGQPYELSSRCSGAVVTPDGYILTAGHCVDPNDDFRRMIFIDAGVDYYYEVGWNEDEFGNEIVSEDELFDIGYDNWVLEGQQPGSPPDVDVQVQLATSVAGLAGGRAMNARVVDYQSYYDGDVAILKVEQNNLPAAPVTGTDPEVGTEIVSVGFPGNVDEQTDPDLNAAYKDGRISQLRTREGGTIPTWEVSAAMSRGMSGGPTVNLDGEIVGINSFGTGDDEGQQHNFVAPATLIREMASRNGVNLELDETSQAYRDGVLALNSGDYQQAVDAFDQVVSDQPSHSKAADLKRIAEQRLAEAPPPDPEPEPPAPTGGEGDGEVTTAAVPQGQDIPAWVWGLVAALVIVVILMIGLAGMLVRARKPKPPPPTWTAPDNGQPTVDLDRDRDQDPMAPRP